MAKIDEATLQEIQRLLDEYKRAVWLSPLRGTTTRSYQLHAEYFVRWLADTYEPGEGVI